MRLPIYTYGQPVLRQVAKDIDASYPNLQELIANMHETMDGADGVGLAAPQVGLPIRVIVVNLDVMSDEYPEYKGLRRAFINAHVVERGDETNSYEEGCLSLPGIHETVKRPSTVKVRYMDEQLNPHEEYFEGFLARVLQHEIDHLDGVLFIDHISPLRKQMIKNKLNAMLKGKAKSHYPMKQVK